MGMKLICEQAIKECELCKVKGWSWALKIITAEDPLSHENGYVTAFGCQYNTEQDTMNTKPGLVHNRLKFRGAIIAQKPVFTIHNLTL